MIRIKTMLMWVVAGYGPHLEFNNAQRRHVAFRSAQEIDPMTHPKQLQKEIVQMRKKLESV